MIRDAEGMLAHMEDCGVLLFRVRTLAPVIQSQLEDRLISWREDAPRWTEYASARHP